MLITAARGQGAEDGVSVQGHQKAEVKWSVSIVTYTCAWPSGSRQKEFFPNYKIQIIQLLLQ